MTYLTISEIMTRTGMKYNTIISWVNKGILPARKITNGRKSKYFFVWEEVQSTIERHKLVLI